MRKYITIVFLFCMSYAAMAHPIKISTGKLLFNEDSSRLELTLNFFIDDFSAHLQDVYHIPETLFEDADLETQLMVVDYINKKLHIKINEKPMVPEYEKMSVIEENVLQVSLYINNDNNLYISTIDVINEMLLEAFTDQANILHVKIDPKEKAQIFRFSKGNARKVFVIEFTCP